MSYTEGLPSLAQRGLAFRIITQRMEQDYNCTAYKCDGNLSTNRISSTVSHGISVPEMLANNGMQAVGRGVGRTSDGV